MKVYNKQSTPCEDCSCKHFVRILSTFLKGFYACYRCGLVVCGRRLYASRDCILERPVYFDTDGKISYLDDSNEEEK